MNAVPGLLGQDVIATDDGDRIDEVFVEVVDIFDHSILSGDGNAQKIEDGKMLNVFANPPCLRAELLQTPTTRWR